jgi:hypothetical protein
MRTLGTPLPDDLGDVGQRDPDPLAVQMLEDVRPLLSPLVISSAEATPQTEVLSGSSIF